jgi:glycolate oxidase FAD binding subunit
MTDSIERFAEAIRGASAERPLRTRGGGSKDFYGGALVGEVLDMRRHSGIVSYEPTELVITARGGTLLVEIEAALTAQRQCLAFEPPSFAADGVNGATVGGMVAAGLSGPRRSAVGAVRDFVLGVKLMDGEARVLDFGGQVMKNVAGYDVSRLIAGSLGTLGLILEVSLKVLPRPVAQTTLQFDLSETKALEAVTRWAGKPLAVSATCWQADVLTVRLSGAGAAVELAQLALGGDVLPALEADRFWNDLRDQRLAFFGGEQALWRLSLPTVAPPMNLPGRQLIEWGGAQRWLKTAAPASRIREVASAVGGHATLFRGGQKDAGVFQPLPSALMNLHRRVKAAFDPRGVLNRGRLYLEF